MEFHVYESARAACEAAGVLIAAQITRKGDSVLGLATGSTPIPAYEMLTQWYDRGVIDFDRVRTFNLDEYAGASVQQGQPAQGERPSAQRQRGGRCSGV